MMSIAYLPNSPFATGFLAFNALQTLTTHFQSNHPKVFQVAHKVSLVFHSINFAYILWEIKQLIDADPNQTIYKILEYSNSYQAGPQAAGQLLVAGFFLAGIAWIFASIYAVDKINAYYKPTDDIKEWKTKTGIVIPSEVASKIHVSWGNSNYQRILQGFQVSLVVTNLALSIFSSNHLFYLINTAMCSYSLMKISQWKWVTFERTFDVPHDFWADGPQGLKVAYTCSLFAASHLEENCAICGEAEPTTLFCNNHSFHDWCIIGNIYGKSEYFNRIRDAKRILHTKTDQGITTEHITYEIKVQKNDMPQCPECRNQPTQNEVRFTISDRLKWIVSDITASVTFT